MAVGDQVPRWISMQMGLTAAKLAELDALSALMGTADQICDTLLRRRQALGITYVVVGDELMETFAPATGRPLIQLATGGSRASPTLGPRSMASKLVAMSC